MWRIIAGLALALATSACALTTDSIDVPYQRDTTQNPAVVSGAAGSNFDIAAIEGRTTYRDRVSTKKNGYGIEMAAIVATNDIPQAVGDAIKQELVTRGFTFGAGQSHISIEIVRFYNDFKNGFFSGDAVADVAFNIKVSKLDSTVVLSKYYAGSGTEPNIQIAGATNARLALIIAFRNAVNSVVSDPDFVNAIVAAQQHPTPSTSRPTS